jgi:hypothetical protein
VSLVNNFSEAVKKFASTPGHRGPTKILCAAVGILAMHCSEEWKTVIEDISSELSGDAYQVEAALRIYQYIAEEASNDNIVIDEEIRLGFINSLKTEHCVKVYGVFELWAERIENKILTDENNFDLDHFKLVVRQLIKPH